MKIFLLMQRNRSIKMSRKLLIILCIVVCIAYIHPIKVSATPTKNVDILLLYANQQDAVTENVAKLDVILHHFFEDVVISSVTEATEEMIEQASFIVYVAEDDIVLGKDVEDALRQAEQPIITISEQTPVWMDELATIQKRTMKSVSFEPYIDSFPLERGMAFTEVNVQDRNRVLLYGYDGNKAVPLMVQVKQHYFIGISTLDNVLLRHIAECFHNIFPNDHEANQLAYLRLENIHPLTDVEALREIGALLEARNIPYMLMVRPAYMDEETKRVTYLKDQKELLQLLQTLQEANGTVVFNGYSNVANASYEFWDGYFDQPMYGEQEEREQLLSKSQFTNKGDYEQYIDEVREKERAFVQTRIEKGIHDLAKVDLAPLAFSPVFHAMSQEGYAVARKHATSLVGNIQLMDDTASSIYAPPFLTSASFMKGMTVYPETVGDISNTTATDFANAIAKLEMAQIVRDGVIGVSYQTYLGPEKLEQSLNTLHPLGRVTWLDLQETEQTIQTEKTTITSNKTEGIKTMYYFTWKDHISEWVNQFTLLEKVLWVVTLFVCLFVVLFLFFGLHLRLQLRKRLFRERR